VADIRGTAPIEAIRNRVIWGRLSHPPVCLRAQVDTRRRAGVGQDSGRSSQNRGYLGQGNIRLRTRRL